MLVQFAFILVMGQNQLMQFLTASFREFAANGEQSSKIIAFGTCIIGNLIAIKSKNTPAADACFLILGKRKANSYELVAVYMISNSADVRFFTFAFNDSCLSNADAVLENHRFSASSFAAK